MNVEPMDMGGHLTMSFYVRDLKVFARDSENFDIFEGLGTNTLWIPKNNCSYFYPENVSQVRIYSLGAVFKNYLNWFFFLFCLLL